MDTNKGVLSIGFLLAIAGFVPWLVDQRGFHMPPLLILWCGFVAIVVFACCLYYPFYPNVLAAATIAFVCGLAVTWWWVGPGPINPVTSDPKSEETVNHAALFLQFADGQTVPKEIRQTNVLSWYALYTESIFVDTKDQNKKSVGGFSLPPRWNIFVLFKKPASYRQMLATCVGSESLKCAVAFSNDRYAIVTATGDIQRATLDISVVP